VKLLVDIGNSRCKAAIEDDESLRSLATFAWHDVSVEKTLDSIWLHALAERAPDGVYVANVAGDQLLPVVDDWCYRRWGIKPIAVRSASSCLGLRNGYKKPRTLGVDRWAAMLGARMTHSGALCVIDSGTATTVDVVDAGGQHMGGAILPGVYTMRRSLGKYTAALFAAEGAISPFSDHTAGGIAGGTGYAAVGAIERFVHEASATVGSLTTVLTGGESDVLASLIRGPVRRDPILVLRGISAIAKVMSRDACELISSCDEGARRDWKNAS